MVHYLLWNSGRAEKGSLGEEASWALRSWEYSVRKRWKSFCPVSKDSWAEVIERDLSSVSRKDVLELKFKTRADCYVK